MPMIERAASDSSSWGTAISPTCNPTAIGGTHTVGDTFQLSGAITP